MNYASSVIDLIGNTPLLALDRINHGGSARIFGKCEFLNPIAIKDRPALFMIREAEKRGELSPGDTLVEATSGNTGMALAYIGRMKGYKVVLYRDSPRQHHRYEALPINILSRAC